MTTKELILRELEQLNDEELDALFVLVQDFLERKGRKPPIGFLERLGEIQISGPEDFSKNFDLYLSGEKSIDVALR